MPAKISNKTDTKWVFVIIQNPGTTYEQYMGFKHDETGTSFVPAFATKEEAQQCFLTMPKDIMNNKYEVQAVVEDDLILTSKKKEFHVYLLDDKGRIKNKLG